jgi:hypothetical protein
MRGVQPWSIKLRQARSDSAFAPTNHTTDTSVSVAGLAMPLWLKLDRVEATDTITASYCSEQCWCTWSLGDHRLGFRDRDGRHGGLQLHGR